MKWLFATLVALNVVVFAGMIAYKLFGQQLANKTQPAATTTAQQAPPQVIINTGNGTAVPNAVSSNTSTRTTIPKMMSSNLVLPKNLTANQDNKTNSANENNKAQYQACSARVSMPEDDYHRIKGLLTHFPHAATRQVVENTGTEGGEKANRMNVLFMSVNDQQAKAIEAVVGRYGHLNRTACK